MANSKRPRHKTEFFPPQNVDRMLCGICSFLTSRVHFDVRAAVLKKEFWHGHLENSHSFLLPCAKYAETFMWHLLSQKICLHSLWCIHVHDAFCIMHNVFWILHNFFFRGHSACNLHKMLHNAFLTYSEAQCVHFAYCIYNLFMQIIMHICLLHATFMQQVRMWSSMVQRSSN